VFDKPVLPAAVDTLVDEAGVPPVWWNASRGYDAYSGQVVVGWAAADHARALLAAGQANAVQQALASLRALLGQPNLRPRAARLTHWNDDRHAGAAYTYTPPGAHDARAALAAPLHNTLYFAGEATDSHHSTVHGALASGRRAAIELLHARQRWLAW
jgi:monoamine oxidase